MTCDLNVLTIPNRLLTPEEGVHSCVIRKVEERDVETIARHRYFRAEEETADLEAYASWLRPHIADGTYVGSVAVVGHEVIAGAGIVLLDWGPSRGQPSPYRGRIVNVFTEPPWRLKGIARSLVRHLLATCTEGGITQFCLGTTPAAAHLYRSLGFSFYEAEMVIKG